ncbi:MAG: metal-dependent transcriptional regulator [Proteobacteria bacterium]|nr:metal-dependent transcriptional regulator [Pseudomonadota bacterium]
MKKALEEILEAIWKADEQGNASLESVQNTCPDKIDMEDLGVLEKRKLITREGNKVVMTYEGREAAKSVVRRHRLAETLFATILNLDAEKREEIACEVEHTLLPEVEEAICTLLGHPTICPDGKPITPGRCCSAGRTMASTVVVNLTTLQPGESGRITYIKPKNHDRLHRLTSFGLTPGTIVELHQRSPAYCIRFEGTELAINADVAEDIYVARIES